MGNTDPRYMEGWRAFERGETLSLHKDCDLIFSEGWLNAMEASIAASSFSSSALPAKEG